MPPVRNHPGIKPLQEPEPEKPHPSRGGNSYSQDLRAAALAGHLDIGIFGVTPHEKTVGNWRRRLEDEGHFRPYERRGNRRPTGLVGSDKFLLLHLRIAFPRLTAAEIAALIFNNSIRDVPVVYTPSEITKAENSLGLCRKRASTSAWQAHLPENIMRRHMFLTMGYPYGRVGIPTQSFIDIDECGIMLEGCNRHYGKMYFGVRVVEKGHYGRGVKWTVTLGVAATGERWCRVDRKAGTTTEEFINFTQHILANIDDALLPGGPRTLMMDNLSAHLSPLIPQLIGQAQHQHLYRPKYSPADAPIEYVFNTLQAELRIRAYELSAENIVEQINDIVANMNGLANYFVFCGY